MISTEEQGVANTVAGFSTSRFTVVNSRYQSAVASSNGVNGNSRRGLSPANSYQSYTIFSSTKQMPTPTTGKSYIERRTFENNHGLTREIPYLPEA